MKGCRVNTAALLLIAIGVFTLAGCSLPTAQLTPQEFQAVYGAPRSLFADHTQYRGVKGNMHRLDVYSLGTQSTARRVGAYTVPVHEMPGDFPQDPQPPIVDEPLSEPSQREWSSAWRTLPRFE